MNVVHIDLSQPSEVEEAVQASVDGANAPRLILWKIKNQMV